MTAERLRSLVVDATPGGGVEQRIEAALRITGEQEAALSVVCAAWPASMSIADALVQSPVHSMAQEQEMRSAIATARSTFDRVAKDSPLSAEWCDSVADPSAALREHGLLADLIVTGLPGDANIVQADPVDLAASTGTPVLRVGAAFSAQGFRRALIGRKDCRESRCALRAALPLLRRCESILIVGVGDEVPSECLSAVQCYLGVHQLDARELHVPDNGKGAAATVTEIALREGYGLLVAGGRSQGRWKERVFGGVTEELLRTDLTWLMAN